MKSRNITSVGVIGSGTMGAGIAQLVAQQGYEVLLYDLDFKQAKRARQTIIQYLEHCLEHKTIKLKQYQSTVQNIRVVKALSAFSKVDLVIEAIIEDLLIKQRLFQQLEAICRPDCLLTSNTSTLSISAIASVLNSSSRLVGMHFFNPAPIMKLVEVVKGLHSDPQVLEMVKSIAESWGKTVVICRSFPGFIVNRIARPFYAEPLALLETTNLKPSLIDQLLKSSKQFPIGPFRLMDLIGIDVNYRNTYSIFEGFYFDKRYQPSYLQKEYVVSGLWGKKTQRGFYDYTQTSLEKHNNISRPSVKKGITVYYHCSLNFSPLFDSLLSFCQLKKLNLKATNKPFSDSSDLSYLKIKSYWYVISNGQTATTLFHRYGTAVCVLDWSFDYQHTDYLGLSIYPESEEAIRLFQDLTGIHLAVLPDTPALVTARTLCMLINESADAVHQNVCSEKDADQAVQFGLNYTYGLFTIAQHIGWLYVKQVLEALKNYYEVERYRVSPLIKMKLNHES